MGDKSTEKFEEFSSFAAVVENITVQDDCFDVAAHKLIIEYGKNISKDTLTQVQKHITKLLAADIDQEQFYQLCQACTKGDSKKVKTILSNYENPNLDAADHKQGFTPMCFAAAFGHMETINLLLEAGATLDASSTNGRTPLSCAATSGHTDAVRILLERGAEINAVTNTGWSPLNSAANNGHLETVKLLIEKKANLNKVTENGWTPLNSACDSGHFEVVVALVEAGVEIDSCNEEGFTPFNSAARKGAKKICEYLLDHGAELEKTSSEGWTALGSAVTNGRDEVVDMLLERGASVNHHCKFGNALHVAQERFVDKLIAKGAELEAYSPEGFTPLHRFAQRTGGQGREEAMIKSLLKHGANINAKTRDGLTALHLACKSGVVDRVKMLIEAGADSNIVSDNEKLLPLGFASSPQVEELLVGPDFVNLVLAAAGGDDEALAESIKNSPDEAAKRELVNRGDKRRNTPLMVAALHNQIVSVKHLKQCGADPNVLNVTGHSAMVWALWHDDKDLISELAMQPTEKDLKGIENKKVWWDAKKGNMSEAEKMMVRDVLTVEGEEWTAIVQSNRRAARDRGNTTRRKLGTEGGEGSQGLEERMKETQHQQKIQNFLPDDYNPGKSLLAFLRDIGSQAWWSGNNKNPDMEDVIWEGKKVAWWKVVEEYDVAPIHSFALFCYTYESDVCYATNRAMRNGDEEEVEKWRPVIYWINQALRALPVQKGRLLRGIRLPNIDFDQYKPGTELTWAAFSSTSLNYKVAVFFLKGQKGVVFDIRGEHAGRLLSPFSQFPMEEEVVLPPNTKVKIESLHEVEWRMLAVGDSPSLTMEKAKLQARLVLVVNIISEGK